MSVISHHMLDQEAEPFVCYLATKIIPSELAAVYPGFDSWIENRNLASRVLVWSRRLNLSSDAAPVRGTSRADLVAVAADFVAATEHDRLFLDAEVLESAKFLAKSTARQASLLA